jgi:hypothetical protein
MTLFQVNLEGGFDKSLARFKKKKNKKNGGINYKKKKKTLAATLSLEN